MLKKDFTASMRLQERVKRRRGAESTADLYRAVRNRLLCYSGKECVMVKDVTVSLVAGFMEWLHAEGLRVNTVNSYISNLRAMYNRCLRESNGRCPADYPFYGLKLRREETEKRSVPVVAMGALAGMELPEGTGLSVAADLALFSFTACGMPFVDLVHLRRENIRDGKLLSYRRRKTGTLIELELTEGMKRLMGKYANAHSVYLFPVLRESSTYADYKRLLRQYNASLKIIGVRLGLQEKFTSYTIRHTWASAAYRQHVDISVISQALGHTSEKMTRTYLARLDPMEISAANKRVSGHVDELLLKRA
ncbi:tyrosine-type recombinase/integrase [Parabacteroides bouchesdurhonensis]|uniref:tyrosine-type recombinase/integrase n=1 Tax=Parabacteroides bouchesdurhonensis TaxID=1936995 RepID=UPI000E4BC855|nr:site-specific integrase [Parabacteroides bouchesdurhonensis]RHJ94231.1 hypothetical protein DW095_04400 [Bacteroides sp. AM07-16]